MCNSASTNPTLATLGFKLVFHDGYLTSTFLGYCTASSKILSEV
jgi:hypothetical protein